MLDRERVPLFPLQAVMFPGASIPLYIFEARYRQMIEECIATHSPFGIVSILKGSDVDRGDGPPTIARVGCLARITRTDRLDDGRYYVETLGCTRFVIEETSTDRPYMTARITPIDEDLYDPVAIDDLCRTVRSQFRTYIVALFKKLNRTVSTVKLPEDPVALSFAVAAAIEVSLKDKQQLLEFRRTDERLSMISSLLSSADAPDGLAGEDDPSLTDGTNIHRVSAKSLRSMVSRN